MKLDGMSSNTELFRWLVVILWFDVFWHVDRVKLMLSGSVSDGKGGKCQISPKLANMTDMLKVNLKSLEVPENPDSGGGVCSSLTQPSDVGLVIG